VRLPRGGDAQTLATLKQMRKVARAAAITPDVRGVATTVVAGSGSRAASQIRALGDWMGPLVSFVRDPYQVEMITDPAVLLRQLKVIGVIAADCDDVATLAAALGLSIGMRARFVVVAFAYGDPKVPAAKKPYEHVFTQLAPPTGPAAWVSFDFTRQAQDARAVPIARAATVEV
jgi:hypothetical protein